jgi:hypothetical protein
MGNLSFEGQAKGWKKLTGWLSLSTGPFKSRRAQLSALPAIQSNSSSSRHSGARRRYEPGIQRLLQQDSGFALKRAPE